MEKRKQSKPRAGEQKKAGRDAKRETKNRRCLSSGGFKTEEKKSCGIIS